MVLHFLHIFRQTYDITDLTSALCWSMNQHRT